MGRMKETMPADFGTAYGGGYPKNDYPLAPGFKEPRTSRNAAEGFGRARASSLRDRVLAAIAAAGADGLTADETATKIGATQFAVRPRLSELHKLGKIRRNGDATRPNESGVDAAVWVVSP